MNASEPTLYNLVVGRCWELPQIHESLLQRVLVSTARDRHNLDYIRRAVDLNKYEPQPTELKVVVILVLKTARDTL